MDNHIFLLTMNCHTFDFMILVEQHTFKLTWLNPSLQAKFNGSRE